MCVCVFVYATRTTTRVINVACLLGDRNCVAGIRGERKTFHHVYFMSFKFRTM